MSLKYEAKLTRSIENRLEEHFRDNGLREDSEPVLHNATYRVDVSVWVNEVLAVVKCLPQRTDFCSSASDSVYDCVLVVEKKRNEKCESVQIPCSVSPRSSISFRHSSRTLGTASAGTSVPPASRRTRKVRSTPKTKRQSSIYVIEAREIYTYLHVDLLKTTQAEAGCDRIVVVGSSLQDPCTLNVAGHASARKY